MTPLGMVCLCFFVAIFIGAILGASANIETKNEILSLIVFEEELVAANLSTILWKYGKYALIFWLAYPFYYGAFASGGLFLFRGICLGYTSAILIECTGFSGVVSIVSLYFLQNIFLLSAYAIPVYCSVVKFSNRVTTGRRFATPTIQKNVEYFPISTLCIVSILLLGIGVMIEYNLGNVLW